jgi:hypothetical protein
MENMRLITFRSGMKGNGKVVTQSIDNDKNSFVERLRVPASFLGILKAQAFRRAMLIDWKHIAGRFVFEDQPSQQKSLGEEVYANNMQEAEEDIVSMCSRIP